MLICGASFAGLAVARELAGSGADVLVVDRYEIGERATSACAAPTPWLHAMGVERSIRQEIPCMAFHTPHGSARFRLPWSWSSFDYRELCRALYEQTDARFEIAKVRRAHAATPSTRTAATSNAPLIVDALGWRRVLGRADVQPPEAPISRGLEVHPHGGGTDLDVWIDRSLVRYGYAWSVPAGGEQRIGVGSYEPRDHVKEPTKEIAARLERRRRPLPGQLVPAPAARRRPRTACSSSATAPATACRSRARASAPRSTSGSRPGARSARCSPATHRPRRSRATARSRAATRRRSPTRSRSSA